MQQRCSWEADSFSANQEILRIYRAEVSCRVHKRPPPVPIICQISSHPRTISWRFGSILSFHLLLGLPNGLSHQVPPAKLCLSNRHILMSQNSMDFVGSFRLHEVQTQRCYCTSHIRCKFQGLTFPQPFCKPHKLKTTHSESLTPLE